jgi:hypothetical protein
MLTQTELDLAAAPKYSLEKTETLLASFDRNVAEARAALAARATPTSTCPGRSRTGATWS